MNENKGLTGGATPADEETTQEKTSKPFGRMGKIFLLAGIVLVQAAAAYAIVSSYYPNLKKLGSTFQSEDGVYYEFKNIIINPAGSNGERYLILSITLELNSGDAASAIDKRKAEVQDRINTVISNYSASELNSLEKRDDIKKNIGIVINRVIDQKAVRNLFFTKYVLQ